MEMIYEDNEQNEMVNIPKPKLQEENVELRVLDGFPYLEMAR